MNNLALVASGAGDLGWVDRWWVDFPLLWIAVIATVIWLVARKRERSSIVDRPLEILAARYARGEIDVNEYRSRRDEIRGKS